MTAVIENATEAEASGKAFVPGVSTIILTHNEEMHIGRAIDSARAISDEILVIDSLSIDRTVEIAEAKGARVLQNPWINYSKQFQWALDHGGLTREWVLRLDADELIEPDLAKRINADLHSMADDVAGIILNRKHIFMGRWVRHGGRYPLQLLRIWRNGQGKVEDRWMDEHVLVWGGRTIKMQGGFSDASVRDLSFFVSKHNGYAAREAIDVLDRRYCLFTTSDVLTKKNSSWQASLKRFFKEHIYNRLPFGVGPICYFVYRFFFQLGFLDGKSGLIYHFMQGLWYRFLVDAKVVEFEALIADCSTRDERVAILAKHTGLKL